jgi:hypothetical protein
VLHHLLIENAFGKAWRLVGERGEPQIEAVDLEHGLAGLRSELIVFATADGGRSEGGVVTGALVYGEAMAPELIKARSEAGPPPMRAFRLSEFLVSLAIVSRGNGSADATS